MALVYKIDACPDDDCGGIKVYDATGVYNNPDNLGGWGSPNISVSNAIASTLSVAYPGSVVPVELDIFADLPNSIPNITDAYYHLLPTPLSLPSLPDGRYDFISHVTVVESAVEYNLYANTTVYLLCGVRCCVNKLLAAIAVDRDCCGHEKKVMRAMEAKTLLDAIEANVDAGDFDNADKLLSQLQKMCNGVNCGCGTAVPGRPIAGNSCGC